MEKIRILNKENRGAEGISLVIVHRLVLFVLTPLLFLACGEKIKPSIAATGVGGNVATQESWKAKITITDSGKVSGILRAGHISVFEDKKVTFLDSGIIVDFFDENEQHTSVLTAKAGKINDLTHDLEAHGNVIVVSDSGTTLKTEDLFWNNTTQKVYTQDYVEVTSPREQINGHGFESDRGLKQYKILDVTGQAKTNE